MGQKMKILIIANARYKGGLSGGDNIYLNFKKHWDADIDVWTMMNIDFKPFWLCYGIRILSGVLKAIICRKQYDFVYSASDFMGDSIPALLVRKKAWVAGYYMDAPRKNKIYYWSQKLVKKLINAFADVVLITNDTLKHNFPGKKTVAVHGGVDLNLCKEPSHLSKAYDTVFCSRIHPTKGIDELLEIWKLVRAENPDATMAFIGDGDLGQHYLVNKGALGMGITMFGYMVKERFTIYRSSKITLYTATEEHDHFSMAPVEGMACGLPLCAFDLPVMDTIKPEGALLAKNIPLFAKNILRLLEDYDGRRTAYNLLASEAREWSHKNWSWANRCPEIFNQITKILEEGEYGNDESDTCNRRSGHGGKRCSTRIFKQGDNSNRHRNA